MSLVDIRDMFRGPAASIDEQIESFAIEWGPANQRWPIPAISLVLLGNATAMFPYRNPGLFTIPLSFAVGVIVSWLTPEPAAAQTFAKLEQQIHFGELN